MMCIYRTRYTKHFGILALQRGRIAMIIMVKFDNICNSNWRIFIESIPEPNIIAVFKQSIIRLLYTLRKTFQNFIVVLARYHCYDHNC